MFKKWNDRMIPLLMWPSMILLTTFLSIYLFKSYQSERENLKKEVGYLFVNAVNSIEGDLMNQFMFRTDSSKRKINFRSRLKTDSMKVMVFSSEHGDEDIDIRNHTDNIINTSTLPHLRIRSDSAFPQETNIMIKRRMSDDKRTLQQTEGIISLILRADLDSNIVDSVHRVINSLTDIADTLKEKFEINLKKAGLQIQYKLTSYKDTSKMTYSYSNVAGTYHDLASGEKYDVQIKSNHWIIFKKLLPEFLLALLLLFCLWLAFYSMISTIRREKNLLDAKSDFIQNMTHELKTPISTVRVALEALHQFDGIHDEKKKDDYLRISQNELDRLSLLVDRVLSMSMIDRALPDAQKELINLSMLISHITDTFKVQAEKQNTRIIIHPSDPTISIYADPQWISGIVYNLLDNAIKYTDKKESVIEINLHRMNELIELNISDNGPGIDRNHQTKIFEKFYRIPQGNVHTVKGHGLGLAFVWRMVKEMGGKISIESELGKGSIFNVSLPAT